MRAFLPCLALSATVLLTGCSTTPSPSSPSSPTRTTPYSNLSPDQASDIAIHALGLVGTPYRYGGNTP
ncbi:MAG: hydrolase Nlp/P60, partial [Xylophilus sp.]|nr:hydrolase Nlp/P60 [Xylophilus sp.]